ncbi:hypothetical protein [Salidesulfovibrio onnuriiensis]|uniref:hypothetical protein n=1 Tax=Salidesulfovibrio onnuriiensis TaxID=2583823 RepID=UPI0011CAEC76|nr:hypothetical protein [Salidesulfovibrio onnuriiensis]
MRNYLIEDLVDEHFDKLKKHLTEQGYAGPIDDIYYLPLPEELLTEEQREHREECGPHILCLEAIEDLAGNKFKMELLVRGQSKIRCSCIAYCTPEQRNHMLDFLDDMIKGLDIPV